MVSELRLWTIEDCLNYIAARLQFGFDIQTGLAGVFVAGMAGGLLIGGEMAREKTDAKQVA